MSMQVVARGFRRIMKSERLPWGTKPVQQAAEKRRVSRRVHLAQDYAARKSCICTGYELESALEIAGKRVT